jgi:hypothetical protein
MALPKQDVLPPAAWAGQTRDKTQKVETDLPQAVEADSVTWIQDLRGRLQRPTYIYTPGVDHITNRTFSGWLAPREVNRKLSRR